MKKLLVLSLAIALVGSTPLLRAQAPTGPPPPAGTDPKPGDPKPGDPKAGDPKAGDPKAGDPKSADPKADPKAGEASGDAAKKPAKPPLPEEIQLSFNNAKIAQIVQWLAKMTGKSIIKHKGVNCQLNIVSSKKMPREEAVQLVYRALALEGFVAVETGMTITIVPEAMEGKVAPEYINGGAMPSGRQMVLKFFNLKHARAANLKEKFKAVLSDKAKFEVDENANKVIVTDYADNVRFVEELVKELDIPAAGATEIKVFDLKHSQAEEFGQLVNAVFTGSRSGSTESGVSILPDKTSNRLIVSAFKEKMPDVESLITSLDTEKPADVAVRTIDLTHVDATELVRELGSMYDRLSGSSLKEIIEIAANSRSNSLIVLSSESNYHSIVKLVERLDTEDAEQKAMKIFDLKFADAEDVAEQLDELYDANPRGGGYYWYSSRRNTKGEVRFVAMRRSNEVIAIGPPGSLEKIEGMVEMLDKPAGEENLAPRIFPLKYVSAVDIAELLDELFVKKTDNRPYWYFDDYGGTEDRDVGRLYGKIRVASEPNSNSLVVTTNSVENFAALERILEQLDVRNEDNEATMNILLNHATSVSVANSLNILFARPGAPNLPRRNQPQPRNNGPSNQDPNASDSFALEDDIEEEPFFPWLGGQQQPRTRNGQQLRNVSDLIGKVRIVPDTRTNSLLVTTSPHYFPEVLKLVEDLDMPTAQVLIEATIVEISRDDRERLGVRWSPDGGVIFEEDDLDNSFIGMGTVSYTEIFAGTALEDATRTGILDGVINLDVLIQFLIKNTSSRVRAEPRLNVADNERGKLFVGSRIPFITNSLRTTEGGENQSFEYRDVGIILEVTPHINATGEVNLKIRVEASQIREGETLFGGAILDTRNYRTEVTVKDGATLVLGGIIQSQEDEVLRKFPILGDIPILKWLFSKRDTVVRDVDLMVFLKPTVTRSAAEVEAQLQRELHGLPEIREWNRQRGIELDRRNEIQRENEQGD